VNEVAFRHRQPDTVMEAMTLLTAAGEQPEMTIQPG
jgi:hypothetical protein